MIWVNNNRGSKSKAGVVNIINGWCYYLIRYNNMAFPTRLALVCKCRWGCWCTTSFAKYISFRFVYVFNCF